MKNERPATPKTKTERPSAAKTRAERPASPKTKTERPSTAKTKTERPATPKTKAERPSAAKTRPERSASPAAKNESPNVPYPAKRYINIYLGLGSNMGNRTANIAAAIALISKTIGKIARKSHLYETEPWGEPAQGMFLNQVVMANTTLDPRNLLERITEIERELGRERRDKEKWGPRPIDIDILFYGKRVIRDKGLEIPHPELHKRAFVLVPLLEIAPDLEHPLFNKQIDELYMACEDLSEVVMLD